MATRSGDTGSVVVVAAEERELAPLATRVPGRKLDWPLDFAWECGDLVLVANGPGRRLAAKAVEEAARRIRIRAVVSAGFCGALDPALAVGDVFLGDTIVDPDNHVWYSASEVGFPGIRPACGAVASIDRVAVTAEEKRELRKTGAAVVEMEASAVAAWCRAADVPFYCIRAVSDTALESLGIDFNAVRDAEGRFSRTRIIGSAALNPRCVPALLRLGRNSRVAARNLGDFLADCRF